MQQYSATNAPDTNLPTHLPSYIHIHTIINIYIYTCMHAYIQRHMHAYMHTTKYIHYTHTSTLEVHSIDTYIILHQILGTYTDKNSMIYIELLYVSLCDMNFEHLYAMDSAYQLLGGFSLSFILDRDILQLGICASFVRASFALKRFIAKPTCFLRNACHKHMTTIGPHCGL